MGPAPGSAPDGAGAAVSPLPAAPAGRRRPGRRRHRTAAIALVGLLAIAAATLGLGTAESGPLSIHRIDLESLAGSQPVRVTDPPSTIRGDILPTWSPDGANIAFIRTVAPDASELRVVSASGGPSRSLLPEHHKLADVDWSPDGRRLLVAVHDGGRHRIWSVDAETGAVEPRPELGDDTRWVTVARRGGRIALGRARWEFRFRRYDLTTGQATLLSELSSTFYDEALDVSPDGMRLAFASTRSGSPEVWVSDLGSSSVEGLGGPIQLTSFGGSLVGQPRWSAGGGTLVFHADRDGRFDLWTVGSAGGTPWRLTGPPGDHRAPTVSRDGASIYFASNRTGDWQVWRMPAEGGEAVQVTQGGGYLAQESPDGRWLYFTRWQIPGLWRLALGGAARGGRRVEEQVLGDELQTWNGGHWAVGAGGIYLVARDREHGVHLMVWSPERRAAVNRMALAGDPVQPSLALTPDGQSVLLAELDRVTSDLVVAEEAVPPARPRGSGHPVARGASRGAESD